MTLVLLIVILLFFVLLMSNKDYVTIRGMAFRKKIPSRFVLIASVWGCCFSFMIIPWQIPDEYTHLQMIGSEIANDSIAELLMNDMPLEQGRIIFNKDEKVNISLLKEALIKRPGYTIKQCMPKGISLKSIRHFPAIIGILLGVIFRLPTYWVLQLGELFSLFFYIFICNKALSLVPIKKEVFELVMLLPMCIQQAASISYDAVLLPICFFLTAYILHLKFEESKIIDLKRVLIILFLLFCIVIIKLPYILLGGMFFLLPLERIQIRLGKQHNFVIKADKRNRCIILAIFVSSILLTLCFLTENEYMRILIASVLQWERTLYLFKATIETFGEHLIVSLIGNFGWLDTPLPLGYVFVLASIIFTFSITKVEEGREDIKLDIWSKIVLSLITLGLIYIVTLSMVRHTVTIILFGNESVDVWLDYEEALYQIPYIGGLQGRYYIPLLLPFFLTLPSVFEIKRRKYNILVIWIECAYILCTSYYVLARYW